MKIGRIALIGLVAVVALAAASEASACTAPYFFSTWGVQTTAIYNYVFLGPDGTTTFGTNGIQGRFWGIGNRAGFNEGTNNVTGWFKPYGAADQFYILGQMSSGELGCGTSNLITLLETTTTDGKSSKFAVGSIAPVFANAVVWDYSNFNADWTMAEVPFPKFSGTKAGSVYTYNVTFTDLRGAAKNDAAGNPVTGYRLMRSAAPGVPSGVDVGRSPAAWTLVQRVPASQVSLTGLTFDCATLGAGQDLFLAVQVEFDNGQFLGDYMGKSTQVKCNSTQADPGFHKIDKPARH